MMIITPRDKEIIRLVGRFRLLRSSQLIRLTTGAPVQILRRLQVLYHHGWLDRPRCQIDLFHKGGSRHIAYCLGSKGAAMLRREFDVPFSRMSWSREGESMGRLFLEHTLMVADIVISVELACRQNGEAVRFIPAEELASSSRANGDVFRWSTTVNGYRTGLVPDAVFALEYSAAPQASRRVVCAIEADRGTMPVTRSRPHLTSVARKLLAYTSLWKSGHFGKQFKTKRIAVFLVTASRERAQNIASAVEGLHTGQGLFVNQILSEVCPEGTSILEHCAPRDKPAKY